MTQPADTQEKSRYDLFIEEAQKDMDAYQKKLMGDGSFLYAQQVQMLERLSHYMNRNLLVYLFGDILGCHLADKFTREHRGNLLSFLSKLTDEYRFFILYELKNNKILFSYC